MQPEQANFLLNGVYLPSLRTEHRLTKSVIEAIPLDKGDYRPDQISKTAMELAWHIAATEMRFMDTLPAGEFDLSPGPARIPLRTHGTWSAGIRTISSCVSKSWRNYRTTSCSRS
jgi:hypothetical protein